MPYENIRIDTRDGVSWITLNRPKVLNAFNLQQWRDVRAAVAEGDADPDVRVMVIEGAGGNFSAGYDLKAALGGELAEPLPNAFRDYVEVGNEACWAVWRSKTPVIAAVRGYCLGGAFEFAMACDFVYADETAQLGEPEVLLADAPPFLISPWVMGMRQAKHILLTGELVEAARAVEVGLVNQVCAAAELTGAVRRLADRLKGFAPETWHVNKAAVNRSYEIMGFSAAISMGVEAFVTANTTPNALKDEFLQRMNRDGFSAAMKWVQTRYGA
ncbi:MAG: enoyl-CoA hydratase/isomerase family protein [Alphaproteobacteria bacterium]|nr:enoyl-CoA hydratase/isomerase family protein [Alphaproteobacteria bacterium]